MALDESITIASNLVATVGVPAYIGYADRHVGEIALYVLVAGLLLTFVDRSTLPGPSQDSVEALAQAAILRIGSVGMVSGLVYFLAILAT